MLTRRDIEDLVRLRLTEENAGEMLLKLSSDRLDVKTIRMFIDVLNETLEGGIDVLKKLGPESIDCCGTGGGGVSKYNVSTSAAFVLAGGGLKVSKFGNRSASGKCGSFDLLEELGFPLNVPPDRQAEIFTDTGLCLLYAPQYFPSLAELRPLRKKLGIKTIFNFIGPLLNPMRPSYRILGVSDPAVQVLLASVISQDAASRRCLLVRGQGNLDEIGDQGETQLYEIQSGKVESSRFQPESIPGLPGDPVQEVSDNAQISAALFHQLLDGNPAVSRYSRMVSLNAGAGFYIAGRCGSIEEGAGVAANLLQSGEVRRKFDQCRRAYASVFA